MKYLISAILLSLSVIANAQVTPIPADRIISSIGINVHPEFFANPPSVYSDPNYTNIIQSELIASGVRYVRAGANAPSGDNSNHKAEYFAREKALINAGIKLTIVAPNNLSYIDTDYNSSEGWYQAEGANEPDLSQSCSTIISKQITLYNAIKVDPLVSSLPVLGPSLTITNPVNWLKTCPTFAGIANVGNWHTYIHAINPEAAGWDHTYYAHAQSLYPNMPIYTTEYGYRSIQAGEVAGQNSIAGAPDAIIARYMPRWILTKVQIGYTRGFWHQIADSHIPSPADPNSGYGLIDYYGNIKPQWIALKNLIKMFADSANFNLVSGGDLTLASGGKITLAMSVIPVPLNYTVTRKSGNTTAPNTMLFQRSNSKYMLSIWLGLPGWNGSTYTLTSVTPEIVNVQLGTSPSSVEIDTFNDDGTISINTVMPINGLFQMTVTDHVQVLIF